MRGSQTRVDGTLVCKVGAFVLDKPCSFLQGRRKYTLESRGSWVLVPLPLAAGWPCADPSVSVLLLPARTDFVHCPCLTCGCT